MHGQESLGFAHSPAFLLSVRNVAAMLKYVFCTAMMAALVLGNAEMQRVEVDFNAKPNGQRQTAVANMVAMIATVATCSTCFRRSSTAQRILNVHLLMLLWAEPTRTGSSRWNTMAATHTLASSRGESTTWSSLSSSLCVYVCI